MNAFVNQHLQLPVSALSVMPFYGILLAKDKHDSSLLSDGGLGTEWVNTNSQLIYDKWQVTLCLENLNLNTYSNTYTY